VQVATPGGESRCCDHVRNNNDRLLTRPCNLATRQQHYPLYLNGKA